MLGVDRLNCTFKMYSKKKNKKLAKGNQNKCERKPNINAKFIISMEFGNESKYLKIKRETVDFNM